MNTPVTPAPPTGEKTLSRLRSARQNEPTAVSPSYFGSRTQFFPGDALWRPNGICAVKSNFASEIFASPLATRVV